MLFVYRHIRASVYTIGSNVYTFVVGSYKSMTYKWFTVYLTSKKTGFGAIVTEVAHPWVVTEVAHPWVVTEVAHPWVVTEVAHPWVVTEVSASLYKPSALTKVIHNLL
jgi:hypothetical protein